MLFINLKSYEQAGASAIWKEISLLKLVRYNIMQSLKLNLHRIYDNTRRYLSNRKWGWGRSCKNCILTVWAKSLRTYFYAYTEKEMPMNVPVILIMVLCGWWDSGWFCLLFFLFSKFSCLNLYYGCNQKTDAHFLSFNHTHHSARFFLVSGISSALLFPSCDDI